MSLLQLIDNIKSPTEMKEVMAEMQGKISDLEATVKRGKFAANDPVLKTGEPLKPMQVKQWIASGQREFSEFNKSEKGLSLGGNESALLEGELNTQILEQAIENDAVLRLIGKRGTENLDYRRTVLTQRPNVQLTKENTTFAAVNETDASDYDTIGSLFTKAYAFPKLTHEVLEQSDVDVESNLIKLLAEQFTVTIQDQILHGDGVDNAGVQNLRGMANAMIDRANTFTEALKPAATRARDVLGAVKSEDADGIGDNAAAIEANLFKLMLNVPEKHQASSAFLMHPETLSFLMQNLKDADGRSLIDVEMVQDKGVWVRRVTLFGAQIVLNDTMDVIAANACPILFGNFAEGVELLTPSKGDHFIVDQYTIPDVVGFYKDMYFGSTVADHEAISALVCVA